MLEGYIDLRNVPMNGNMQGSTQYGIKGDPGPAGPAGDDYVLTDADRSEIAEMAADLVVAPGSGWNSGYVVQDTAPEDTSVLWVDPTDNSDDGFQEGNSGYVVQDTAPEDTSFLWVDPTDNSDDGFQEAVNAALAKAKESGIFNPVKGKDYFTEDDKAEMVAYMKSQLQSEQWTFELEDGSTVTKAVYIK